MADALHKLLPVVADRLRNICGLTLLYGIQIQLNGFADVLQGFFARPALGPATFQRRAMSHEVTVFAMFKHDFQLHGIKVLLSVPSSSLIFARLGLEMSLFQTA